MNATRNESARSAVLHLGLADSYIIGSFYVIFGILGLFGNLSIIVIISTSRIHRQRFSGLFLVNLAFADFLVCLTAAPYNVTSLILKPNLPGDHDPKNSEYNSVCKLPMFLNYFITFLRILSLTAMSIDRYLAINHPYFYARYCMYDVSRTRCLLAVAYVWLQGLASMIPALISTKMIVFFGSNGRLCGILWSESTLSYVAINIFINVILPAIIILFTNCKVFWLARKHVVRERIKKQPTRNSRRLTNFRRRLTISDEPKEEPPSQGMHHNRTSMNMHKERDNAEESQMKIKDKPTGLTETQGMLSAKLQSDNKNMEKVDNLGFCNHLAGEKAERTNLSKGNDKNRNNQNSMRNEMKREDSEPRKTRHIYSLQNPNQAMQEADTVRTKEKREQRPRTSTDWEIALSTLAMVVFYFISYLPFMVTRLLTATSKGNLSLQVVAYTTLFTALDSAINPLIIFKTRREFRTMLKKKLCGRNSVDKEVSAWSTIKRADEK